MNKQIYNKPHFNSKITIGNEEAIQITDFKIKQNILNYLYSAINLSNYRYKFLNEIEQLEYLQNNEHYVSPNFIGQSYFLIYTQIEGKKYCVLVQRQKLNYSKNQTDIKQVNIYKVMANVDKTIFNGTIFDGKLIVSNNKSIFLVQDCYTLMNKDITNQDMIDKINNLDEIMKSHLSNGHMCNNFVMKLNKLYKYEDLENIINKIIPTCSLKCNGLIFYPKQSGGIIIFNEKNKNDKNDNNDKNISNNSNNNSKTVEFVQSKTYDMIYNFVEMLKSRNYSYEKDNKTSKLWLAKTNIPDVYTISETINSEKLGIAHIPNIKTSHLCNELIKNEPVLFDCIYHSKFKKWIPLNKTVDMNN